MTVSFLTLDEVLALHANQIQRYGGRPGLRDIGLLESALAMPRATFAGRRLHESLHEMAAAYLFHIVRGHPFIDGNKRAALMTMLAFLRLNARWIEATERDLFELVSGTAAGRVSKAEIAVFIKGHLCAWRPQSTRGRRSPDSALTRRRATRS